MIWEYDEAIGGHKRAGVPGELQRMLAARFLVGGRAPMAALKEMPRCVVASPASTVSPFLALS